MNKFLFLLLALSLYSKDPWNGAEYNKNSEEQKAAARKTLATLSFSDDANILDIGCGDGYLTALIAQQAPKGTVVGIDLSPSMISFATDEFSNDYLSFRTLDAQLLDYEDRFDLITSFTTLHWIPDQLTVLQGIERALCAGGKMIVDMPTALPKPLLQAVEEKMAAPAWNSYFKDFSPGWRFFTASEYQELLEQANLNPIQLKQIAVPHTFPSKQAFMAFLKQWFPYLRPLPDSQKALFLEQVVDRYLQLLPPQQAGQPDFIVNRLRVEATK